MNCFSSNRSKLKDTVNGIGEEFNKEMATVKQVKKIDI